MLDCSFECHKGGKIHTVCWQTVPHVDDTDTDLPSLDELIDDILYNLHHVRHSTLPEETASSSRLRRRRHNRELVNKSSRSVQSCFVVPMLYKDIY